MARRITWKGLIGAGVAVLFATALGIASQVLGVWTLQPIGAVPDGVSAIVLRGDRPFFDSADAMCLSAQDGVSLLCRAVAAAAVVRSDRIIVRLPYSEWAYLRSTDGQRFEH